MNRQVKERDRREWRRARCMLRVLKKHLTGLDLQSS
jgi:hypothetical protein